MNGHSCAGFRQTGSGDRKRYVMRCRCGWETTPRASYDRGIAALRVHLGEEAGPAAELLVVLQGIEAKIPVPCPPDLHPLLMEVRNSQHAILTGAVSSELARELLSEHGAHAGDQR